MYKGKDMWDHEAGRHLKAWGSLISLHVLLSASRQEGIMGTHNAHRAAGAGTNAATSDNGILNKDSQHVRFTMLRDSYPLWPLYGIRGRFHLVTGG